MAGSTVAVVVATRDRAELVRRTLDSLRAQTRPPDEVIVVDDGSADGTGALLDEAAATGDLPLRTIRRLESGGPAVARNAGWRAATADIIAFTDDDCRPRPDWLERLADAAEGADLVQGRVVPDPTQVDRGRPFVRTLDVGGSPFFETANIAYRRSLLDELDGFDERMRRGEDTDLGQRALRSGATAAYDPEAVVDHEVFGMDLAGAVRNAGNCYWVVRVVRTHPDLRRYFWTRRVLLPHHRYTAGAAVGLAAVVVSASSGPRRRRAIGAALGAAAAAPWAWFRLRRRPTVADRGRRILWLPGQFVVECAEVVAVLRARHGYAPRRHDHGR